jgi:hypothetical protein
VEAAAERAAEGGGEAVPTTWQLDLDWLSFEVADAGPIAVSAAAGISAGGGGAFEAAGGSSAASATATLAYATGNGTPWKWDAGRPHLR